MGIEWGCGGYCSFPEGWERGPQFPKLFFHQGLIVQQDRPGWYWGVRLGDQVLWNPSSVACQVPIRPRICDRKKQKWILNCLPKISAFRKTTIRRCYGPLLKSLRVM